MCAYYNLYNLREKTFCEKLVITYSLKSHIIIRLIIILNYEFQESILKTKCLLTGLKKTLHTLFICDSLFYFLLDFSYSTFFTRLFLLDFPYSTFLTRLSLLDFSYSTLDFSYSTLAFLTRHSLSLLDTRFPYTTLAFLTQHSTPY